jgi:hypothetical protein
MKATTAITVLLGLICAVILFHLCIIANLIPYHIAWGGRLQNDSQMYVFESISIAINLFLGTVLLMKAGFINSYFSPKTITVILWIFCVIFTLNTIGNLFARTDFERSFSLITLVFAMLIWIILRSERKT